MIACTLLIIKLNVDDDANDGVPYDYMEIFSCVYMA